MSGMTDEKEKLKQLSESTVAIARDLLKQDGEMMPMWHLKSETDEDKPDKHYIVATPFENDYEKDKAAGLIRVMCLAYDITLLTFASECWFTDIPRELAEGCSFDEMNRRYSAGEFEDYKYEGLNVVTESQNYTCLVRCKTVRDDAGKISDVVIESEKVYDKNDDNHQQQGRFTLMLPPERVRKHISEDMKKDLRRQVEKTHHVQPIDPDMLPTIH